MLAVILAGGRGESLRLNGERVPRVLLPLGDKPLLEHQLAWLSAAAIDSAVLCLGAGVEEVRSRFGDGSGFGLKLRYSVEESPLGTAGAVKALGPASLPEDILVLYGDVFPRSSCREMLEFHAKRGGIATVAVHECPASHSCDRVTVGLSRRIDGFTLRSDVPGAAGVSRLWIIRRPLLHLVPDAGPSDFVRDVFPEALRRGEALAAYPEAGPSADLGDPARYARFRRRFPQGKAQ